MQDILGRVPEEAILELLSLEKTEDSAALDELWFESESLVELRNKFEEFSHHGTSQPWLIVSCGDLNFSASRIRYVLKKLSRNFLCFTSKSFLEKRRKLLHIMHFSKQLDRWIVVITAEDSSILESLNNVGCLIIVIVLEACSLHNTEVLTHKDHFSFDDLTDKIKERLQFTPVLLQGHKASLGALLSQAALSTIPVTALLDWYRNRDEVLIGKETNQFCGELFIHRYLESENNCTVNPFETNLEPVSILSGLPGIGKTVLLSMMVAILREKFDDHIVIMEDTIRIVDGFGSEIDATELIAKLLKVDEADRIQKFVIQKLVEDRRVILLLDGFDEVSLTKQSRLHALLQWIQSVNFKLVIIATRPHRLPFLRDNLYNPAVYSILPFTEENQLSFLQHHFQTISPNEPSIPDMIQSFRKLFNDDGSLQIPLQCSILASIHDEPKADQCEMADFFQKYIDRTFELYASRFFDLFNRAHEVAVDTLRVSFGTGHSKLAFELDTHQSIEKSCFDNLEQYGLLRIDEGTISFIHPSLKEFFIALYLVTHYVNQQYFNHYLIRRFCQSTINRFDTFLEHHIRREATRRKLEGPSLPILRSDLGEFRNQRINCLPVDKLKQFHVFLVECCSVETQIEYLRSSLAKGQFGIFETVYQSLPASLVHVVRFKFESKPEDPLTVDLSTLNEGSLRKLLTILHRQHSLDIVEKIIANFSPDEDDFISTAIVRNYDQVIQQIFTIEQNLNSEDESDLLLEYAQRRLQRYLTVAVEYGRADLLANVFDSIGRRFHPRVIKHFLMNLQLEQVLVVPCRGQNASAVVAQRIVRFAEQYLSEKDLRMLLKRKLEGGESYGEKLKELRNPDVQAVCKAFWERYGTN